MAGTTRQDGVVRSLLLAIGLALGGLGVSGLLTGCGGKPPSLTHAEPLAPGETRVVEISPDWLGLGTGEVADFPSDACLAFVSGRDGRRRVEPPC